MTGLMVGIIVALLTSCAAMSLPHNSYKVYHGEVYESPSMVPLIYYSARF